MPELPPILAPEVHREAIRIITEALHRHRGRAQWARITGASDVLTREIQTIRSARRALHTHRVALSIATGATDDGRD